ncbi:uncharacterized protein FOMMEDRAFT_31180 [Fomitiporia mediterranea MF3/22]|uniref:uncharacterized protein n=1 Tax=Fomitiporia mediterranea (strain MF3/22) TaxID=694068 RepID=UPI0004407B29|nr:uncharacterized protein FOMMEDRAFT_31180 [Fomitiporia mediterranea MF3/22]EJC99465.1 hypothetical protein FOMMEDRAFT_31180 [Fomitiporia mediterranea MF3/22]
MGSGNFNEFFTPTTLSPIHSDAGTDTDEFTPERNVPGEAIIEATEQHGLPHPLPATSANETTESSKQGGRFSLFPFRSSSKDDTLPTTHHLASTSGSGAGGKIGEGAYGTLDPEEEEKKRLERRATKLVRAHARGFQFLAGFKGNKALARLAPEDIDPEAPLPRRPTRFSRRRPQSVPADRIRENEMDSSPEQQPQHEHHHFPFTFGIRKRKTRKEEDEDVEDTAANARHTHHAPLPFGSGVLGALLTLYDRPANGMRSGLSTPGDRTPSGSEPVSPESESFHERGLGRAYSGMAKKRERDSDRELEREREKEERGDYFGKHAESRREREESKAQKQMQELERINTRLNAGSMFENDQERERELERDREHGRYAGREGQSSSSGGDSGQLTPPHPLYAQKGGTRSLQNLKIKDPFLELSRTMSGGIERIKEKASPSRIAALPIPRVPLLGSDPLPSGARNAGGVFGSLIASTGNITGVAAPVPSRIAPDPKRPGFHLSRYSWDEEVETDAQARKRAKRAAAGFRTPGHSPQESMLAINELGSLAAGGASDPMMLARMSKSAPTTPAGELAPSLIIPGATPSPAGDDSPASVTPLIVSTPGGNLEPAPPLPTHISAKSLDGTTLVGERPSHNRAYSDTLSLTTVPTRGSAATTLTANTTPGKQQRKWAGILKDFQKYGTGSSGWTSSEPRSGAATPDTMSDVGSQDHWDEKHRRWVNSGISVEEKRKRKRKKAEIFITRHVAEIMQRQEFIMKLARAFMMFGAPSHRLPAQIQATARVLDMELSCMYLPDVMLISFDDAATSTSNIKFIRQGAALSLGKLQQAYDLYWKVIHDEVGVGEASRNLDALMQQRQPYSSWQLALFGGFCSAAICQILSVRNELYSNVFEITIATLLSFLSAVFAGTHHFCYSAVASGSIVLILPGFLVLNGSLELSSRNIISGSVRLCYAIMYAIFLGFGLSIGGTLYEKVTHNPVSTPEDYTCASSHHELGPWYQRTPSTTWAFLTVPMFSLFLSLRNQAPWRKKELLVTVLISCLGWTCNHFSALKFPNRSDVSSAIGAFVVGFVANIYGRFFSGNAFVIMITGILFQLPSGLGNGGLITFASQNNSSGTTTSYLSGFKTALQLISVCVGLTVGLGISLVVVFPIQSRKRAGGIFSL